MLKLFKILLFTVICISSAHANSNIKTEQAKISLFAGSYEGGEVYFGLKYALEDGWKIYWRQAGDTGFPMSFNWSDRSDNIDSLHILWPYPKRDIEQFGDILSESYIYKDEVIFPLKIKVKDPKEAIILDADIDYAICKDICIPGNVSLKIKIDPDYKNSDNYDLISAAFAKIPFDSNDIKVVNKGIYDGQEILQIIVDNLDDPGDAEIFIEAGEEYAFYNPQLFSITKSGRAVFNAPITFLVEEKFKANNLLITVVDGEKSIEQNFPVSDIGNKLITSYGNISKSLYLMILFAFIGGLILNVMPCVLPVLSIKLLSVIKHADSSKSKIRLSFIATAFGIITSFLILALIVILLKSFGNEVGWGFHFQEPLFIIALVIILTIFAANLWGLFEINLPRYFTFSSKDNSGIFGSFCTGILATTLATPCTAPFLGTAVGFALGQGGFETLIIFISMGLGLSLPYLLISLFPNLVKKLPKPGAWMNFVRKIMAILLLISALWLIWILSNQLGNIAAFALFIISILKLAKFKIAFANKRPVRKSILLFLIIMAFLIPVNVGNNGNNKNADLQKWNKFDASLISDLVASGKVVFVDVTADWCLTCKANKFFVLQTDPVLEELSKPDIFVMVADWTNKNDEIAKFLKSHGRSGIPFNIIYGPGAPEGIILSELLSEGEIRVALDKARLLK
ncbi:protein-disulfide reductase DsbD family protein [Rickettsiales bacterium]|nr:protein-disulfide reductase DsbD family protein [Rickettsiales bacterium]